MNNQEEGNQHLPEATRSFFEPRFGHDFSQVRVHTDSEALETAQALNSRAFTIGQDVVFGQGQYSPGTAEGRNLLAHELTHVVQQNSATGMECRIQRKNKYIGFGKGKKRKDPIRC